MIRRLTTVGINSSNRSLFSFLSTSVETISEMGIVKKPNIVGQYYHSLLFKSRKV